MQSISVLIKPSSGNCNMKCDYCFYKDEQLYQHGHSYEMMSTDTLNQIIQKTLSHVTESISYCFQGGEPLLSGISFFQNLITYQNKWNVHHVQIQNTIQTNGTLITSEWCEFFRDNHILVGISLDGTEFTHNKYRHMANGMDSFETVMNAIRLLKQYKIDFNVLTVLNHVTAQYIENIYSFYQEQDLPFQQYIACRDPFDAYKHSFSLSPREYGECLSRLFRLWFYDLQKGSQPYIRAFENYIGILLGQSPENCEQCGNCSVTYAIESNGDVYPCDFYMTDAFYLGNLLKDSFTQIDKKRKEIQFIEHSRQFHAKCKSCKYLQICRNGCHRNRDFIDNTYINHFCEGYRLFFDKNLEYMTVIANIISRQ